MTMRTILRRIFRHRHKIAWNADPARTITATGYGTSSAFGECQRCGQLFLPVG